MSSPRLESLTVKWMVVVLLGLLAYAAPASAQGSKLMVELRAGSSIPAGDLDEITDAGAVLGVGLGWRYGERITLRLDGDWEFLNEQRVGTVVMPQTFLWHYRGGVELDLTSRESTWLVGVRGSVGGTTYDTDRLTPGGDDFMHMALSAGGGLSLGRMVNDWLEVGALGQISVVFTDKDRTRVLSDRQPSVLVPFSKASSFPLTLYFRWPGIVPGRR